MKLFCSIVGLVLSASLAAQIFDGKKLDVKAHPESVHFDGSYFYVSNLGVGANGDKDEDGYISVLSASGDLLKQNILPRSVKLHTPTGMASRNGMLFVVDMDRIVALPVFVRSEPFVIDLSASGATFLNDVAFISERHLIVTESQQRALYLVDVKTRHFERLGYSENFGAPNGVSYDSRRNILFVAANLKHGFGAPDGNGQVLGFDLNRRASGRIDLGLRIRISWGRFIDGIEPVPGSDHLFVSDWTSASDPGKFGLFDYGKKKLIGQWQVSCNGCADFSLVPDLKLLVTPDLITGHVFFYSYGFARRFY